MIRHKNHVVIVNKQNRKLGIEKKLRAHKDGKLHRAFSIFIFNSKNQLLIQQRAKNKYHSPKLWSNSVCSHPGPNETYLKATHRRLKEEMGFDCKLKKIFCFIYNTGFRNGLIENEYDCVFVGKFDGKPKPNKKEIMAYRWIFLKKLKKDISKKPNKYSVWLKMAIEKSKNLNNYGGVD